jgi:uracil-DNA glycosylase
MGIDSATFYDDSRVNIVPMGFCYPGTGPSGDLPPRPECAAHWRTRLLGLMPDVGLTLIIGKYAMDWHLGTAGRKTVTETVRHWRDYWPERVVVPHPSPRNNIWLRRNPWFEDEVLPSLKARVRALL